MAGIVEMAPRGHYLAREAGQLAGISGYEIGQWSRYGYIRATHHPKAPHVYAFGDIGEAMVVHELLIRGVKRREIRLFVTTLRRERGLEWPLLRKDIRITVKREDANAPERKRKKAASYLLTDDGERYVRPAKSMQQGMFDIDTVRVAKDLERGGWIVRDHPNLKHIEVDPDRLSGQPVIRGTRVPASDAGRLAVTAAGEKILKDDYGLSRAEINDARDWWRAVSSLEAA